MQKYVFSKIVIGKKKQKKNVSTSNKKEGQMHKSYFLKFLFMGGLKISYVSSRCQINHPVAYQHFCWFDKLQVKGLTLHNVAKLCNN